LRTNSIIMSRGRIALPLLGTAALAAGGLLAAAPAGAATPAAHSGTSWVRSCAVVRTAGEMACNALRVTSPTGEHVHALGVTANATPSGYGPSSLLSAYNLPANGGAGQTVAIIDAYNDPNAASDLATYRAQYGLPACTTASGCFKQVSQTGSSTLPSANAGWAEEESLDIDMVSAIAPEAHIILVEAKTATTANLGTAVNEAVKLGAKFVSNSYGGSESSSDPSYDASYYNHPGVAITVSAGDGGYGVEYPAASQYVTAVGGTSLSTASNARGWTESVWSTSSTEGTGSGCSVYDTKPTWQKDTGCSKRTVSDVSAVADPATGVAVYDNYGGDPGWEVFGGTSVASPIIASVYADAGTPTLSYPASGLYADPSALNDVTTGSTSTCSPAYLCTAEVGYDGPTGLGTPNGLGAF
jgi:subtilase family serine protease